MSESPIMEAEQEIVNQMKEVLNVLRHIIKILKQQESVPEAEYEPATREMLPELPSKEELYESAEKPFEVLEKNVQDRFGMNLEEFIEFFERRGWEERTEQNLAEERAEGHENLSDLEHQKELNTDDPNEAQKHEELSEQEHQKADVEWDTAEARGERAAFFEAHADAETAHAATLNDAAAGVHPHKSIAQAKAHGHAPQQAARVPQPKMQPQVQLSH
ncbi:hypothetical protein CO690_00220 (plasmid) [Rothia mucilaginosa]|jgi:hypothetical protein|uniref:Uncharacterized protein n=1 Tax=Rothia mucilaginosa TaxID=43675 RepID=A0A291DCP1_9MICC|nr:hypothetical protein [Rothia mucilaginosa]ATF62174.1 hypothetical protein CO690_00220 [Rothia mucilaginosa]